MALETDRNDRGLTTVRRLRGDLAASGRSALTYAQNTLAPVLTWLGGTPPARYLSGSLLRRILVSNLLSLVIVLGGVFYLSVTHNWLLEAKRQSLQKQGQIIATAIGENTRTDVFTNHADGEATAETRVPFRDDAFSALEFSLSPERVTPILNRIIKPTDARARIYDRSGNLVVDTSTLLQKSRGHVARPDASDPADRPRTRNLWTQITQWMIDNELPVYREIGNANGTAYPEVRAALEGKSAAILLLDGRGEQIVAIAEPIRRAKSKTVQGVLFLSTRPGEISAILNEERSVIWTLAAFALTATLISSWLLARTVAEPMRRLSEAAEHVSRNIEARTELPDEAHRKDEVGQMAVAFRAMTAALFRRIEQSEKFAADVAHELKNPLAAARSTAEALTYAKTDAQRDQLVAQIQGEIKRLSRLITDVSNASRLDAEMARQPMEPQDVRKVVGEVVGIFRDIHSDGTRSVVLAVEPQRADAEFSVLGHDGRLAQVATNLIDNALSFTPEHGTVTISVRRIDQEVEIAVADTGPGIPADRLEAIFERFYSDRPETDQKRGKNSGLGLSISREIVLAHNGRIYAENIQGGSAADKSAETKSTGARFVVRLPAAVLLPRGGAFLVRRT